MNTKCRLAVETYHMLCHGDSVVVGLSGGADSCALLHWLCGVREEYGLHLIAVHVNHGIRGEEAARDAAFAEELCRQWGVDFRLYERNVPQMAAARGIGMEECGRVLRYEIFEREAAACGGRIATAHTLSDSVETMLFHMMRGCAVNGLRGIPPVRGHIIRPLIFCEREDIETYCVENDISYVTDSTNLSTDYTRNKIRLQILPLMKEMNPSVTKALIRLAQSAADDDDYLDALAQPLVDEYWRSGRAEGIFAAKAPVASRALVRICEKKWGIVPEHRHVSDMLACMRRGRGSVGLPGGHLPGSHLFVVRGGELLFCSAKEISPKLETFDNWECECSVGEIITPYSQKIFLQLTDQTKYENIRKIHQNVFENSLDYDRIKEAIFRFRKEGDRFTQAGRGHTKSLKKLFNERKIPPARRNRIPLLVCGGRIAWIGGIGVAEDFRVTQDTTRILMIQIEPPRKDGTSTGADTR